MKIPKKVVDCEHAIYPFGTGAPCCIKRMVELKEQSIKHLLPCKMNKCENFKLKIINK